MISSPKMIGLSGWRCSAPGDAMVYAGALQRVAIDRAFHALTRAQDTEALVRTALRLIGQRDCNMQPGSRRTMLDNIEGLVNGVGRGDEKVRASLGTFLRGGKHQFGHARPVVGANALHILRERMGVHRDFRMIVRPPADRRHAGNRAVAEGRTFGAAGVNADVLRHRRLGYSLG